MRRPPILPALLLAALALGRLPAQEADLAALEARCAGRLAALQQDAGFPGAALGVVLPDGSSFGVAAGSADREKGEAMTPESKMLSGSIGKTYFAAWILRRVEQGKVGLDEPISKHIGGLEWFDRLPNAKSLTLRHLMTHQSGIPEHVQAPGFLQSVTAQPDKVWQPGERVAWILDAEPLFAPGEGWSYADTNFIVATIVVEAATGEDAYASIRQELLGPLGLADTLSSDRRVLPGLVQGHPWLMREQIGAPERTLLEDGRFFCNPQMEWAGGGFCSTTRDLARWGHFLLAGDVLQPATLEQMRAGVPANTAPGDRYGLGLQLWDAGDGLGPVEGHGGWFPGYLSELAHFRELGLTMALQVNTDDVRQVGRLRRHLVAFAQDLAPLLEAAEEASQARAPFTPTDGYELRRLDGWPVRIHRGLIAEDPGLLDRTLDELGHQFHQVARAVPGPALTRLREVEVWVEDGATKAGMCFHPSEAWLRDNGYNPDKTSTVELTTPENFLGWIGHQQWMVLHELAHAYHFRVLDAERPALAGAIREAYQAARDAGSYDEVLIWDGRRDRSYAMTNEREYFAELSEAWFGVNDIYPFVRAELLEHDPAGAAAVAAAWGFR